MAIAFGLGCGRADDNAGPNTELPGTVGNRVERLALTANGREVATLFARLRNELGRHPLRQRVGASGDATVDVTAVWGRGACDDLQLGANNVATGDFFPAGWTAADGMEAFRLGSDWDVVAASDSERIAWVRFDATCQDGTEAPILPVSSVVWGEGTTDWVFSAAGASEQELDLLLAEFAAASLP